MKADTIQSQVVNKEDRFNPYPANVDKMVALLPVLANGRWDLIRRLKG
jgi:hypothetical protein